MIVSNFAPVSCNPTQLPTPIQSKSKQGKAKQEQQWPARRPLRSSSMLRPRWHRPTALIQKTNSKSKIPAANQSAVAPMMVTRRRSPSSFPNRK